MNFLVAFIFSFFGSIPPGSLNLSVIQLSLEERRNAAFRFALAAAIVEAPYALIAVRFQDLLLQAPIIVNNFKLIAAIVMFALAIINLFNKSGQSSTLGKLRKSGFRKGLVLSILNPLAIPFWIGVTAYLTSIGWVELSEQSSEWWYIGGISTGTFALLSTLTLLSQRLGPFFRKNRLTQTVPGFIFLLLGIYALYSYFNLM